MCSSIFLSIARALHMHTNTQFLVKKDITEKSMTIKPSTFNIYNLNRYLFCTGGRNTVVLPQATEPYVRKGDVIGCALDLTVPVITFTFNGHHVKGSFRNFNLDGMFFPVISCSSKLRYSSWLWLERCAIDN
jgi:hypothetical protein